MRRRTISAIAVAATAFASYGAASASTPARIAGRGAAPVEVAGASGTAGGTRRPTRILSLSASATQMLYAIGAGGQVVGVDKYSTYPPNAPRTSFTGYESSAEDYLPLRPDLVILAFDTSHLVAQLHSLHIATLVLPPATTVAGADTQIRELGRATGHAAAAGTVVVSIHDDLAKVVRSVGTRAAGRTYYIELDPTYYSATSKTFIGSLFSRFGMVDVADAAGRASSGYPQLSAEYLVKSNPDYVFLADTVCCAQSARTFAARPGFAGLRAVHLDHVIPVNDSTASEWGPHSLETFAALIARAVERRGASGTK